MIFDFLKNNLFLRNRSRVALGCSKPFSAVIFSIIPHVSDSSFSEHACSFFGDYGHFFFASETFTWYHDCRQHWSGYGQPEAIVNIDSFTEAGE